MRRPRCSARKSLIQKQQVLPNWSKVVMSMQISTNFWPDKDDSCWICLTVSGNWINYPHKCGTPTAQTCLQPKSSSGMVHDNWYQRFLPQHTHDPVQSYLTESLQHARWYHQAIQPMVTCSSRRTCLHACSKGYVWSSTSKNYCSTTHWNLLKAQG